MDGNLDETFLLGKYVGPDLGDNTEHHALDFILHIDDKSLY